MRLFGGSLIAAGVFGALVLVTVVAQPARAIDSQTSPVPYYSPLYVTAFRVTNGLDVAEIYNDSDAPVDTTDWKLMASDNNGAICKISLSDYVLPGSHVTLAKTGIVSDSTGNVRTYDNCEQPGRTVTKLQLIKNAEVQESIDSFLPGVYFRKGTTKTYRSGQFSKDFEPMSSSTRQTVYADPWYMIPADNPLQITEILAHSTQCSPLASEPGCNDYIKFYNPTTSPIDLSLYRLRSGYQGQSASSSNTFPLAGTLAPGHYGVLQSKSDGSTISLTNSGDWAWFEDSQGLKRYDNTVTEYPDAGSSTKTGWAWGYNNASGDWQWTVQPTPYDQPSKFVLPVEKPASATSSGLVPCASNQYRSEETNRCRLLSTSTSTLRPCAPNQYRSQETNRCRLLSSSSTSLKPCEPGQTRNPLTNRCKSTAVTSSSLKPCAEDQVRNPDTNRCRKAVSNAASIADFPVKPIKDSAKAAVGWWAFGGVGVLALGYAGWEWRHEVANLVRRTGQFFTGSK